MSEPYKVKVLDTAYNFDENLVTWLVHMPDGKDIKLVMDPDALMEGIGIVGKATPHEVEQFGKDVTGKEINLVINGDIKAEEISGDKKIDTDRINKAIDNYFNMPPPESTKE